MDKVQSEITARGSGIEPVVAVVHDEQLLGTEAAVERQDHEDLSLRVALPSGLDSIFRYSSAVKYSTFRRGALLGWMD